MSKTAVTFTQEQEDEYRLIAEEILRIFDFGDNIVDALELDGVVAQDIQIEISNDFIQQVGDTGRLVMEGFAEFYEKGGATPSAKEKVATAIRSIFAKAEESQGVIEQLPKGEAISDVEAHPYILELKKDDKGVLPTQEELGVGEIRKQWESLMTLYPWLANLCRACEMACTQVFRLNYRFAEQDIALVDNPQHLQPGRQTIDAKMKMQKEREKSIMKKAQLLTQMASHASIVEASRKKSQDKGGPQKSF